MKSVETKLTEALAKLEKRASASKYQEVCAKLLKLPSIEPKLHCVKEALKKEKKLKEADPLGLTDLEEAKRDPAVAVLFGAEPMPTKQPTQESKPTVKKHNGAAENFDESNPLQRAEGRSAPITETKKTRKDIFAKGDKAMLDAMEEAGEITKEQSRFLRGKKSKEAKEAYKDFNDRQKKEFNDAIMLGFSEADALKLATL